MLVHVNALPSVLTLDYAALCGSRIGLTRDAEAVAWFSVPSVCKPLKVFPSRAIRFVGESTAPWSTMAHRPCTNAVKRHGTEHLLPVRSLPAFLDRMRTEAKEGCVWELFARELPAAVGEWLAKNPVAVPVVPVVKVADPVVVEDPEPLENEGENATTVIITGVENRITDVDDEMDEVPFHGDVVESYHSDGDVWSDFWKLCGNFGVDTSTQLKKLKSVAWATIRIIRRTTKDGKTRMTTVINRKTLVGWLFSLNANKIKEEYRDKLAAYQRECVEALDAYFAAKLAKTRPANGLVEVAPGDDVLLTMIQVVQVMRKDQLATNDRVSQLEVGFGRVNQLEQVVSEHAGRFTTLDERMEGVEKRVNRLDPIRDGERWLSISSYCNIHNVKAGDRRKYDAALELLKIMDVKGLKVRVANGNGYTYKTYPESVLAEVFGGSMVTA